MPIADKEYGVIEYPGEIHNRACLISKYGHEYRSLMEVHGRDALVFRVRQLVVEKAVTSGQIRAIHLLAEVGKKIDKLSKAVFRFLAAERWRPCRILF